MIPAIPLCLAASGFSSNLSLGPPRPARRSAVVSHRRSASLERLAPGSVELLLVVVCSILPSLRKYLEHYMWSSQKNKKYWEVKPLVCSVTVQGQDTKCASDDEFKKMVTEKFGLGF